MDINSQINGHVTDETLVTLLHRTAKFMVRAHHHKGHAEHAQMRILAILQKNDGSMNQRELQDMLNVRSASLSEILGKLEHRNFIQRNRDEQDKRNVVITLTEQGSETVKVMKSARQESAGAIFASFSQNEREQLAGLLQKVIYSLEGEAEKHRPEDHRERAHQEHEQHYMHQHGRHGFHHDARRHSRGGRREYSDDE